METESQESKPQHDALIASFCEIASSTKEEAAFFLESHNWDLDAAISTFLDDNTVATAAPAFDAAAAASALSITRDVSVASRSPSPSGSQSPDFSPSRSPSRSRSPSPTPSRRPYELRSRGGTGNKPSGNRARGARTLADLNRPAADDGSDDESDEPQEYNAGGQGRIFVQDPTRGNDVDTIFNQAAQSKALLGPSKHPRSSSSKSFVGQARLLSGESVSAAPQPPEVVNHTITFWTNGFTVDDGPLRRLDDPENAPFLECVKNSTCPPELAPADRRTAVHLEMIRREEDYPKPAKQKTAFRGMGRTLGSSSSASSAAPETTIGTASLTTAPLPSMGLVVDDSLPTTSLQLRLADGTRMVSRFNHCHTIRDIRSFIDASRPGGSRSYQLQIMGFPPKQLTDLEQTIEQAGIANSVVIQRL